MNEFDNPIVNTLFDPQNTLDTRTDRRFFLKSSAAFLAVMSPGLGMAQSTKSIWGGAKPFTFDSVPLSMATDGIVVPKGYRWAVVAAWGDPINGKLKFRFTKL